MPDFAYDVALSFAGEDREYAQKLNQAFIAKDIRVFYDMAEAADLWGKDLIVHLGEVYGKQAQFCIMFISKHYPLKKWTNHERMHAQNRAFRDPNEYILPLRLDDTEVPGLPETIGHMDLRQHSIEGIATLLEQKLMKAKGKVRIVAGQPSVTPALSILVNHSIPMPKRKKTFTQLDKDQFGQEAFKFIRQYFQQGRQNLEMHYPDLKTDLIEVTNLEFICKIYMEGNIISQCAIWLGGSRSLDTIYYSEGGTGSGRSGTHSYNDYVPVVGGTDDLRLQIGNMSLGIVQVKEPLATMEEAAEYLWRRLTYRIGQS